MEYLGGWYHLAQRPGLKNWFSLPPDTSADDSSPLPMLRYIRADLNLPVTLNVLTLTVQFC